MPEQTATRQFRTLRQDQRKAGDFTSGGFGRSARQVREAMDPRATVHYNKKYGFAASDAAFSGLAENQQKFKEGINQQNAAISQQEATIKPQYDTAYAKLVSERDSALSKIGQPKDINNEYRNWMNSWTTLEVMTGSPNKPGKKEGTVQIPREYLSGFSKVLSENSYPVLSGKIYIQGRGKEMYDAVQKVHEDAKGKFYTSAAPEIKKYNQQVSTAKSAVDSQFKNALSNLNVQFGAAQGQVSAAKSQIQALQLDNEQAIAEVRDSYKNRISRINEALSFNVNRGQQSRSEAAPVKQIDPRISQAQQGGQQ